MSTSRPPRVQELDKIESEQYNTLINGYNSFRDCKEEFENHMLTKYNINLKMKCEGITRVRRHRDGFMTEGGWLLSPKFIETSAYDYTEYLINSVLIDKEDFNDFEKYVNNDSTRFSFDRKIEKAAKFKSEAIIKAKNIRSQQEAALKEYQVLELRNSEKKKLLELRNIEKRKLRETSEILRILSLTDRPLQVRFRIYMRSVEVTIDDNRVEDWVANLLMVSFPVSCKCSRIKRVFSNLFCVKLVRTVKLEEAEFLCIVRLTSSVKEFIDGKS